MRRKLWVFIVAAAVMLSLAAPSFAATKPTFTVFAAASLNKVFPAMVPTFKKLNPRFKKYKFVFNFNGTDILTNQIVQGATPDIFAGASTSYGATLFSDGLIAAPVNFCQNKLIVITPASNPAGITTLADLAKTPAAGTSFVIAIGDSTVPVGKYTRTVLKNYSNPAAPYLAPYGTTYSAKVLANAEAQLPNVSAVVLLVETANVDAGFCYVSDAVSAGKLVKRFVIPDTYQSNPLPTYPIATLTKAAHPALAQKWVKFVMGPRGQRILKQYAFLPKPATP